MWLLENFSISELIQDCESWRFIVLITSLESSFTHSIFGTSAYWKYRVLTNLSSKPAPLGKKSPLSPLSSSSVQWNDKAHCCKNSMWQLIRLRRSIWALRVQYILNFLLFCRLYPFHMSENWGPKSLCDSWPHTHHVPQPESRAVLASYPRLLCRAPSRWRHRSRSLLPRAPTLLFEAQLASAEDRTVQNQLSPGLARTSRFPPNLTCTAWSAGLGLPLEEMWAEADSPSRLQLAFWAPWEACLISLFWSARLSPLLLFPWLEQFLKSHHLPLLTYFWLHYFSNRIIACQSWKEDHLVQDSILQMKTLRSREENRYTQVRQIVAGLPQNSNTWLLLV